ncbi:MAG: J domain-containing protein [Pseudobdellovibrio sp.]
MLNSGSFSEILNERLEGPSSSTNYTAGWESTLDALGMAQILAQTNTYIPQFKSLRQAYGLPKPQPVVERPAHLFSATQQAAYDYLKAFVPQFACNFDQKQLKSSYRLAVLKTHPDKGGTSESFQEVKKSYQILEALVK